MRSSSLSCKDSSLTNVTLKRRYTVARNATTMKYDISCGGCDVTIVSETTRTAFRLPFEAKIVTTLVLLAATLSISRTSTLLSNFDARYGLRSLQIDQATESHRLRVLQYNRPRVVFWHDSSVWDLPPVKNRSAIQLPAKKSYIVNDNKNYDDNVDDNFDIDPTRQYDQNDSADLPTLERTLWPNHDFDPHCQPAASWQSTFHPTCNEIHSSADFGQALIDGEFSLLSRKGYWRHAWLHQKGRSRNAPLQIAIPTVWKTLKFAHHYEEKYYEDTRVDAVAMERLTGSPYVINMYGFCGLTVVQEYGGKDLTRALAGGKMTSRNKLNLAKQIAEGVHHIHSIGDADVNGSDSGRKKQQITLVHNDINLANLLFTVDNRPLLNDFNIAKLGMRHNITGEMCAFYSHFPNPQWKSPEEQVLHDDDYDIGDGGRTLPIVNEKVDIYALGNIYYRILTGSNPWKRPHADRLDDDDKAIVARVKKLHGATPPISDIVLRRAQSDPALHAIMDVMNLCYRFHPEDRPPASKIVQLLSNAIRTFN